LRDRKGGKFFGWVVHHPGSPEQALMRGHPPNAAALCYGI
jgi:hypothetical protein